LKKFSLKIPFKTFHASAKVRASLLLLARINEKILGKGFQGNHLNKQILHEASAENRVSDSLPTTIETF
jgi:hypothetical protein